MDKPAAIVTGGSRGIGRAIALELARLGYDLVMSHLDTGAAGRPDNDAAEQTTADAAEAGADCLVIRADIADTDDRGQLVAEARKALGRCDMLVNNAGVAPSERRDMLEVATDSYDRVMTINLKGPFFLTQAVANWMIEQQQADLPDPRRIVNISSISAYTSSPARAEYCLSKAGVSMMTTLFADRLAQFGIGVFEIRPGIIATDMTAAVKGKYDALIAEGLTPIKRWGQPDDVAHAVGAIAQGKLD
ncbi:MAG: 3-ketoacyl-ACP reductase, partial [Phycisphaerae bacterium]|nr:3-ketoacyl-ACP reductase [Phycisphaerae bacterium]